MADDAIAHYIACMNASRVHRRGFVAGGIAAAAALAVPARGQLAVPAVPSPLSPYQRKIFDVATRERDRAGKSLWRTDIVGVADFGLPSSRPRLHFANLEDGSMRSYLVAHGRGSDPEHDGWLKNFSNLPDSQATSRGGFLTCEWYTGKYGTSIRLVGMENDNSEALNRAIVMHSAWYAEAAMIDKWGKLGRSEGCFAMSPADFDEALLHLSGGRLLFADRIGETAA